MKKLINLFLLPAIAIAFYACNEEENLITDPSPSNRVTNSENFIFNESDLLSILDLEGSGQQITSGIASASYATLYTLSNESSGNRVLSYTILDDGGLSPAGSYETGGTGTDGGLGNQGALAISKSNKFLYAINAGSNEISAFYINNDGSLYFIDKVNSGGIQPISVTVNNGLIFAVNAGGNGNIQGFAFDRSGQLVQLPDANRSLSTNSPGPAQISFSPNGQSIVVTEKATNTITSYNIGPKGQVSQPYSISSAGITPFGFTFGNNNVFFVSEASMGAANASTVSSYKISNDGKVSLIDGPFPTNGSAACWVAATKNAKQLFVTNTAGDDISSLSVSGNGNLSLANGGNTTPAFDGPIDAITAKSSKYLYTLAGANDTLLSYRIGSGGSLREIDSDGGLPAGTTGLAVKE